MVNLLIVSVHVCVEGFVILYYELYLIFLFAIRTVLYNSLLRKFIMMEKSRLEILFATITRDQDGIVKATPHRLQEKMKEYVSIPSSPFLDMDLVTIFIPKLPENLALFIDCEGDPFIECLRYNEMINISERSFMCKQVIYEVEPEEYKFFDNVYAKLTRGKATRTGLHCNMLRFDPKEDKKLVSLTMDTLHNRIDFTTLECSQTPGCEAAGCTGCPRCPKFTSQGRVNMLVTATPNTPSPKKCAGGRLSPRPPPRSPR